MSEMEKLVVLLAEQLARSRQQQESTDLTRMQFEHSLARFNDSSSQTVAAQQQAFAQQMSTWGAHMLTVQDQICSKK